MSRKVKPGRWQMRNGKTATVEDREGNPFHPWRGCDDGGVRYSWMDDGAWFWSIHRTPFDLVEYLGPAER